MKKSSMVIGAVVIIALLVIVLFYSGLLPNELTFLGNRLFSNHDDENLCASCADCSYSDRDIFTAFEVITGKDLDYATALGYIRALHMQMCGIDDKTYTTVLDQYKAFYENQSYVFVSQSIISSSNWYAVTALWRSVDSTEAKAIIVGSGSAVVLAYGHDTMILIAYGPTATWYQFWVWLNT